MNSAMSIAPSIATSIAPSIATSIAPDCIDCEKYFYNINGAIFKKNMLGLDFDWTLVQPKNGTFPKDVNDWKLLYPTIPEICKKYYDDDYMLVIFTNQTKLWKIEQILQVVTSLQIPMFIVISMNKSEHKPNIIMFDFFIEQMKNNLRDNNLLIDKELSLYIGDALGRPIDHSDCDKQFAENIGIKYLPPEDIFELEKVEISLEFPEIRLSYCLEVIIMIGFPASGKSTISRYIVDKSGGKYIHIEGDIYKTSAKMIKEAKSHLGKSIIFDATNSSCKKRKEYIDFAKKYNYLIKFIHVTTSENISYKQGLKRTDKQIPKIAYSVYKKHFEMPSIEEFDGLQIINI